MGTKLQKHEIIATLTKYGTIYTEKKKWWDVSMVPYGAPYGAPYGINHTVTRGFQACRKVEYLALKEIERNLRYALEWEVKLLEANKAQEI